MQARLHQSLGNGRRQVGDHRDQHLFWVQAWANLQKASDAIAFPQSDDECLEMWQEHCGEYVSADIDFGFQQ